ncbi:MAG TPA: bifunctional histidinol-phosphatase/imidazoleglycerol-phosphate dehydratase HisB [Bacteroidia bacterium]|nr:bifunctional histidinol-phosphatase/imidazoleglycerol-phosphate dehydratase HisB [Bacteroidia bacterium]
MKNKVLFIDRDGTMIWEPPDTFQIDSFSKLRFLPGVIENLRKIVREFDYELVMVTNQDGLGTEAYPEETFWPIQDFIMMTLSSEKIGFHNVFIDRSFPYENKRTRKPGTAMLTHYMNGDFNLADSYVIGDRITDVKLAENLGCKSIFLKNYDSPEGYESSIAKVVNSWDEIYSFLKSMQASSNSNMGKIPADRFMIHVRNTNETKISIQLNLDGKGNSEISTGIAFFDHMLDQLAKHGGIDLKIHVKGDLHIDEHHTIEDTALALGEAFLKVLGDKRGIQRYGFLLPMDDCLAQVAIDFGGRPWLVWDAEFKREKVGEMPTEMFMHFFKSFSDTAKCNLNIKAEGTNEHHKIEAIFKAFAKAIKMAVKRDGDTLPSTKGVL